MSGTALTAFAANVLPTPAATDQILVTIYVGEQMFGVPVHMVGDVLREQDMTPVPLAAPEIAGLLNLRGRIVTVIDVREKLGLPRLENKQRMSIVVEYGGELYSLLVDSVGEVLTLPEAQFEASPPNLDSRWLKLSGGVFRLAEQLLIVLEVGSLLGVTDVESE